MQVVQIMTWIIYQLLSPRFFACLHSSGSGSLVKGCYWMYSDFGIIDIYVISSECRNDNRTVLYSQDGGYLEVRGELLQEDRVFFCSQVSHDPNIGTATFAVVLIRDRNSDMSVGFGFHTFTTTDYFIWTVLTHFCQICNAQKKTHTS